MTPADHPVRPTADTITSSIGAIGRDLASSFGTLLEHIPGAPLPATQLAQTLKVDKALAIRLLAAVKKQDPLATVYQIPGPAPLRRVTQAASRKGVPDSVLDPTRAAVEAFNRLIKMHGGDRSGLDAIIAASLPEARPRYETVAKQSIYRGARQIKGVAADVWFHTVFMHPSRTPARVDVAHVEGYFGLRRVRPNAHLNLEVRSDQSIALPGVKMPQTLDGEPVENLDGLLLPEFCSKPLAKIQVHRCGVNSIFAFDWGETVGCGSSNDIVMAEVHHGSTRLHRSPDDARPKAGFVFPMTVPTRIYLCDLLLHKEVFPNSEPKLNILELGALGVAEVNDESRKYDEIDVMERIEAMPRGITSFRIADLPKHVELLQHVCRTLDWNPDDFRGYRTQIEYPIFGSQVQVAFEVPLVSDGGADSRNSVNSV